MTEPKKYLEGEIIPPGKDLIDPKDIVVSRSRPTEDIKIFVDLLGVLQEGEDGFFQGWADKWDAHKKKHGRSKPVIGSDERNNIIATSPPLKEIP
jgi:hypothetical protein